MKNTHLYLTSLLFFFVLASFSQNTFDIVFPNTNRAQKCQYFEQLFSQKPKEISFSIAQEKNKVYFEINDKKFFNQLFKNSGDGIAIDAVPKSIYDCEVTKRANVQIKGILLKPVYSQQLKSNLKVIGKNRYRVLAGELPETLLNENFEFNILFLKDKNLCRYQRIYDIESYPWDLLDMGMYLDSLTYNSKKVRPIDQENYVLKYKSLKFEIPFEKNKSEYLKEDIKPLYDSLKLTDFNVKKISIRAYSSIEGSLERNLILQEHRAKSIANALQTFQKPTITTEVNSSENWVEFLNDISDTEYAYLRELSKAMIKTKLVGSLSSKLEPYLKNHRKAVIELDLEKKDKYKDKSIAELIVLFNTVLAAENLQIANDIQNSIFDKLKESQSSPDVLNKMNIPKQVKFAPFINKNAVHKFLLKQSYLLIAYNELKQLEKLVPRDKKVKYNLAVLTMSMLRFNAQPIDEGKFRKEIYQLENYGISQILIDRIMVNYHIVKSEKFMRNKDYVQKDKSVSFIEKNYKKFALSDYDYLSLAQFLTYYSNHDKAVALLDEKARSIVINEDLLFYYLNLTLVRSEFTRLPDYRTTMLNAVNMNKKRFCKLFNSIKKGGVTFQLLEDDYLRKTYCENCTD
jgi:outer membrane protein OmpA-like peptidoglycan-associated protein